MFLIWKRYNLQSEVLVKPAKVVTGTVGMSRSPILGNSLSRIDPSYIYYGDV